MIEAAIRGDMQPARLLGPDEALERVRQVALPLASSKVPLSEACGLMLAEPILADRDYPAFPRAMMDGFAVQLADAGRVVPCLGEVAAGQSSTVRLAEGTCLEIMTGASCPMGTEAVVPQEQVRRTAEGVLLPRHIGPGQHIATVGSECPMRRLVLRPGEMITPLAIAVMASFGHHAVLAVRRPAVAVITTGNELARHGSEPTSSQIRDSNGPMLLAALRDLGVLHATYLHAGDHREELLTALEQTADRDLVLLSGGVSVGNYDLVPGVLAAFGAELVFHKVRQKPGKPLLLARKKEQLLFGLPGNPLACHFCFHRYVTAAMRGLQGDAVSPASLVGFLAEPVQPNAGRTHFVTARSQPDSRSGTWRLRPVPGVSSADIFGAVEANCYLEVPPGNGSLDAGQSVRFAWIGPAPRFT